MRDDFYSRVFGSGSSDNDGADKREKNGFWDSFKRADGAREDSSGGADNGGSREDMTGDEIKAARGVFSRIGLSLTAFTAVSYAVIFIASFIVGIFFYDKAEEILGSAVFSWVMNIVAMYLTAFPVLFIILRNMKTVKRPKSKLYIDELFHLFLICEAVMIAGNLIGTSLNNAIGALLGREVTNGVAELITDSPIWLVALVAVIIGPIVEELIFRRLIIDRLSIYGDLVAVIVSAVLFGLFHGNLYQFFYAFGLGIVLGYVYVKTRNILYPIIIHMAINALGSLVPLSLTDLLVEFEKMAEVILAGGEVDMGRYLFISFIILAYAAIEYGMAIAGAVILFKKLRREEIYISKTAEITIPKRRILSVSAVNIGMLSFLLISLVIIVINIFVA